MTLFPKPHLIGESLLPARVVTWAEISEVRRAEIEAGDLWELMMLVGSEEGKTKPERRDAEKREDEEDDEDFDEGSVGEIGRERLKGCYGRRHLGERIEFHGMNE